MALPKQKNHIYHSTEYIPRGPNILQVILKKHFNDFTEKYEDKYNTEYGRMRLERIRAFADSFSGCGDFLKGVARIQCQNPDCKHEFFRPFSCKKFYFCPSCSQKRAMLFGEHISEEVLLKLPHRHFVFSFPKLLRPYFRNNKKVLSDVARLINDMIIKYYSSTTGKNIRTGIVLAFQSYGDFLRYNAHFHSIILEGGFDEDGNFIFIPIVNTDKMREYFRKLIIKYFRESRLISPELANNLLSWKHSGFSIDNSIRISAGDNKAREAIAQYISRCPVSLNKIIYEPFKKKVIFKTKYNSYFKENLKIFDADEFIGRMAQHIPLPYIRLIRYFDLYSSKSRGKWSDWEHVAKLAPNGWKEQNGIEIEEEEGGFLDSADETVPKEKCNSTWARLIAKIYEVEPFVCPKCKSDMKVVSIITNEHEISKIIKHLMKTGKAPPQIEGSD